LILALIVVVIGILQGCTATGSVPIMCRHEAMACALAMGEKYGFDNVGVAMGPATRDYWHAQAYVHSADNRINWITNGGKSCKVGEQENFHPIEYMTIQEFMTNQFPGALR